MAGKEGGGVCVCVCAWEKGGKGVRGGVYVGLVSPFWALLGRVVVLFFFVF